MVTSRRTSALALRNGWTRAVGDRYDQDSEADASAEPETTSEAAETPTAASEGTAEAGTIVGTLGEEDRTWTALYMRRDGRASANSTYQTRTVAGTETYSLSVAGHVGTRMSPSGSLRVNVLATESFDDCPCTDENATIEYVVDLPDDIWEARQATVTIDAFRLDEDGTYGAEGSFSGTLSRPDGSTVPVEGTFDVRRILRVGEGA